MPDRVVTGMGDPTRSTAALHTLLTGQGRRGGARPDLLGAGTRPTSGRSSSLRWSTG